MKMYLGMIYGNFQEISGFQHLRAGYSVQTWILFRTGALLQSYCVHGLGMQAFSPLFAPTHLRLMDHRLKIKLLCSRPRNANIFSIVCANSSSFNGPRNIKLRRQRRPCAYYANPVATFHIVLDVGDLVFKLKKAQYK